MSVTAAQVRELREKTGVGMMDCKKALIEANGNVEEAIEFLRKKGMAKAAKRAERSANEGMVGHYIHMGGKIGVLVEVNCETDFVARTDDFKTLAKDLAMHIAASQPVAVSREDVPEEIIAKEREIYAAQMREEGKPEHIIDKIVNGKIEKYYSQICLLEQPFVKNPDQTVQEMITDAMASLGENIVVRRFVRFQLGEDLTS
ncbi:MAG: translation elongation factor Ts [Gemmatimonadetes bacterium]|nr:MAG: translation elongation factor Ts [Gemmatimonadota bacterium]